VRLSKSFGNPDGLSYDLVCPVWLVAMGVFPLFKEKRCIMGQIAPWERAWQSLVGSLNLKLPGAGEENQDAQRGPQTFPISSVALPHCLPSPSAVSPDILRPDACLVQHMESPLAIPATLANTRTVISYLAG